jgi:hypothetical protein
MKITDAKKHVEEYDIGSPKEMLSSIVGDVGIDGLLSQLGIDPKILNNPLVRGYIDKYAPSILEKLKGASTDEKQKDSVSGFL